MKILERTTQAEQIRQLVKTYADMSITEKRKREHIAFTWNTYISMAEQIAEDNGNHYEAAIWHGYYGAVCITTLEKLTIEQCVTYVNYWCDKLEIFERSEKNEYSE